MLRVALSLLGAFVICAAIFWSLQRMITTNQNGITTQDDIRFIDFVRLQKVSEPRKKERVKPKKPKPLAQPRPVTKVKQVDMPKREMIMPMMMPDLDQPLNLSGKAMLGDAVVGGFSGRQIVNTNVTPLSRVNPVYPRRAKMLKIEGYVQVEFTITASGNVRDVAIVKSYPKGVFDTSAKRALLRWTFKPKMEAGEAVAQRAGLTINYRLRQ